MMLNRIIKRSGLIRNGINYHINGNIRAFTHSFEDASMNIKPQESIHEIVINYYGKQLQSNKDLKTNACTASPPPESVKNALKNVPSQIKDKFYGCGSPIPTGINGLSVLDLGSGSGQDCYIASQFVGENGNVIGIDMTDEQLNTARTYIDTFCKDTMKYSRNNMEFKKGYIEFIREYVDDNSIDLCMSNCVINLSPRKDQACINYMYII